MSTPEWPPARPEILMRHASPEGAGRRAILRRATELTPPAQPMQRVSSSSLSRLRKYLDLRSPPGNWQAPVRPLSSSIVNTNSSGPWATVSLSMTASAAATPTPSSAPRVVPSALSQSPSTTRRMGSVSKLWTVPSFFSQTMSRWPWMAAGARGLADDDIAGGVLNGFQAQPAGQSEHITAGRGFLFRGAGNGRESCEVLPDGLGFEMVYGCGHDRKYGSVWRGGDGWLAGRHNTTASAPGRASSEVCSAQALLPAGVPAPHRLAEWLLRRKAAMMRDFRAPQFSDIMRQQPAGLRFAVCRTMPSPLLSLRYIQR